MRSPTWSHWESDGRMRRLWASAAASAGLLLAAAVPAGAAFSQVNAPFAQQSDLAVGSQGRLMSSVAMSDGSLVVAEMGTPFGQGYLHRLRPGQQVSDANRLGGQLDIISLVWRRGFLYGIVGDTDPQGYYPLVRLDPGSGAVLATVAQWPNYQTQMLVDPLNGRLVMQDGGPGQPIVELDPDTGQKTTMVATAPSADVEGMAFDASGQTLYLGNSNDSRAATGTASAGRNGVYAYDRSGTLRFFFVADDSPDGLLVGRPGTCFSGQLLLTTDQGHVFLAAAPSATSAATLQLVASTPTNGGPLILSADQRGNPVISHDGEVTVLECPVPPTPAPVPAAPPPAVQPVQPAPAPAPPARPPAPAAVQGHPAVAAPQAAPAPAAPPAPPPPGLSTAAAPVAQPAVQAATQAVSQAVSQSAPAAGLADVPDDEHSIAFSAAALDPPLSPVMRLLLGAGAVTGMAAITWVVTGRRRQTVPAEAHLQAR